MATYHLLPQSSSSSFTSSSTMQSLSQAPIQQRKALSFAILILLVAIATLITIIRFTVNPNLNGRTFVQPTNAFALHRAHMLAKANGGHDNYKHNINQDGDGYYLTGDQKNQQENYYYNHHVKNAKFDTVLSRNNVYVNNPRIDTVAKFETNEIKSQDVHGNEINSKMNTNSLKFPHLPLSSLNSKISSSSLSQYNFNQKMLNSNSGQVPDSVSPSSKTSFTSLIADQRFEKDYRDDPVTMSSTLTNNPNNLNNIKPTKPKPKVIFDHNDLAETERMHIDKGDGCGEDFGAYADLLVLVNSAVYNFDARSAIRETWGKFAVERGAFLYFLLGSTEDIKIQDRVENEDRKYGDILQGAFYDDYYNLTLKTITMMRWVSEKCAKIRYVLKVDDDMMMNMQHACDFTEINPNFHKVIIGKLAKKWKPHRSKLSKWYVPYEAYNQTYFPNFVTGPAYFFTGDAARPLLETSINRTVPFYLEDVYMTGVVAEAAGIRRFNHAMMRNVHLKLDPCTFPKVMTSHKHTPNDIRETWKMLYSGQKCVKVNATTRTTPKARILSQSLSSSSNGNNNNNNNNKNKQSPQQQPELLSKIISKTKSK